MTANFPLWLALLAAAPFVGSFLGVVIRRLPDGRPILRDRSQCDCCGTILAWHDLLPILSWIWLKARCRYCGCKLGFFFPAIEIAAFLPVIATLNMHTEAAQLQCALLGWAVIPLIVLDGSGHRVPLALSLVLVLLGLASRSVWAFGLAAAAAAGLLVEHFAGMASWRRRIAVSSACVMTMAWGYWAVPAFLAPESVALAAALVVLASIDVLVLRLPDLLTLPLLAGGIALSLLGSPPLLADRIAGGCIGYLVVALIALVYRKWRGRDGIGLGDAKLLAAAGAWLGWTTLPSVLLLASVSALIWVVVRYLMDQRTLHAPLPFGAPLAAAFWIVWLYGPLAIN
jgi:leader peptidase (prepilin peptidase)/N-methyltransferase